MQKRLNEKSRVPYIKRVILLLVLLLFLFLLLWIFLRKHPEPVVEQYPSVSGSNVGIPDTVKLNQDTLTVKKDTVVQRDTVTEIRPVLTPKVHKEPVQKDTVEEQVVEPDTVKDSVVAIVEEPLDPCLGDTSELWVYPDPSGGLHRKAVKVHFSSNRSCTVFWRFANDTGWTVYDGNAVSINSTITLVFKAVDSCGMGMEIREEYYEIAQIQKSPCSSDMEYIKIGATEFCIDRYEWPNRKGTVPMSYISLYHAQDSCFSAGKRLCTSEEWYLACSGPQDGKYPYGEKYEKYACATHDSIPSPSGSKPECRGFFEIYDMSGGLMEWTSTRAKENSHFNYVMGGFWQSGPQSGCSDKRYSYYSQNRHNPVGFRCCQDLPEKN